MTDEQKKLVEDNLRLATSVCNTLQARGIITGNQEIYNDCLSVASEALCNAAITFDPEKGKFSVYAFEIMKWEVWKFLVKEYSKGVLHKSANKEKLLEISFCDIDDKSDKGNISVNDEIEMVNSMVDLMKIANNREKDVLSLLLNGYNEKDIGSLLGLKITYVRQTKSNLKHKMHDAFSCCA